jgi:hypothetical protein
LTCYCGYSRAASEVVDYSDGRLAIGVRPSSGFAADSALEERRFEPPVPLTTDLTRVINIMGPGPLIAAIKM